MRISKICISIKRWILIIRHFVLLLTQSGQINIISQAISEYMYLFCSDKNSASRGEMECYHGSPVCPYSTLNGLRRPFSRGHSFHPFTVKLAGNGVFVLFSHFFMPVPSPLSFHYNSLCLGHQRPPYSSFYRIWYHFHSSFLESFFLLFLLHHFWLMLIPFMDSFPFASPLTFISPKVHPIPLLILLMFLRWFHQHL